MSALCQSRLRPRGRTASATAWSSRVGQVLGRPSSWVSTRRTLASTAARSSLWAKMRTARAVYGPMPGQRAQAVEVRGSSARPAVRRGGDGRRGALLQAPRPVVVAEALPAPQHVGERRRGEALEVGPGLQPLDEARRHPRHLGLLQHDLADQDRRRGRRCDARAGRAGCPRTSASRRRCSARARRGDGRGEAPAGLMCRAPGGSSAQA